MLVLLSTLLAVDSLCDGHLCCLQVERPDELKEIVPQKRLADKVSGILSRIEAELDAVDEKIGERMHILDLDNDGLVSPHTWIQELYFDGDG